jgi:hypothetical protein
MRTSMLIKCSSIIIFNRRHIYKSLETNKKKAQLSKWEIIMQAALCDFLFDDAWCREIDCVYALRFLSLVQT